LVVKLAKLRPALLFAVVLGGCASPATDGVYDPFEPVNRHIFDFNHSLDKHAALPAASYYKNALPDTLRTGVHNFMANLAIPVSFANDVLQGEMTYAGYALCRLSVNTTIGVLGFMDPATDMGCVWRDEDFGQTLGRYGVPGGPYLVLPLIGSSLTRDMAGKLLVDHYFNPLSYVQYDGKTYVGLGQSAIKVVDQRSRAVSALHEVERTSIDYYAAMRRLYALRRNAAIMNGPRPEAPVPPAPGDDSDDNPTPADKPTTEAATPAPAPLAPDAARQ
jgi:phospholipid-binding lipoprotein MlaA